MLLRDHWPREDMRRYQRERLRALVEHAIAHSPYYRKVVGRIGADAFDLHRLPVLTKSTLTAEFDSIVTDPNLRLADAERHIAGERAVEPLHGRYRVVASSGTTGQRGIVVYDPSAWDVAVAGVLRALATQGLSVETRVVGIGAPTPLHMTNRLFAELRAGRGDAPRLAVTTPLSEVVEALNAYRPEAVITYPSFIRRLAEEQEAGRLRIAPRMFSSCAEALTQDVRDLARRTWDAVVLNVYATTETNLMAIECPWASGLHVAEDLLVVEVVDQDNRPVPDGTPGCKVLATNLFNRALPLIRYEISDIVTVAECSCPCGRPGGHAEPAGTQRRHGRGPCAAVRRDAAAPGGGAAISGERAPERSHGAHRASGYGSEGTHCGGCALCYRGRARRRRRNRGFARRTACRAHRPGGHGCEGKAPRAGLTMRCCAKHPPGK